MWRRSSRVLETPPDLVGLGRVGRRCVHEASSSRDAVGGGGTDPPAPAPASQRLQRRQQAEGGEAQLGPQGSSVGGIAGSMRSA
jgi:hypothetical protein